MEKENDSPNMFISTVRWVLTMFLYGAAFIVMLYMMKYLGPEMTNPTTVVCSCPAETPSIE